MNTPQLNPELIKELLVAIRGKRSQMQMSEKLGYSFNQFYRWEAGYKRLLWEDFVEVCRVTQLPLRDSLKTFYRLGPENLQAPILVRNLIGQSKIQDIAKAIQVPRLQISRWIHGHTKAPLFEVFQLMNVVGLNFYEFLASLVEIEKLSSVVEEFQKKHLAKTAHYEVPFLGGIKPCLELQAYLDLEKHREGFIAKQLNITLEEEQKAISLLETLGEIHWNGKKYVSDTARIDTGTDRQGVLKILEYWAKQAVHAIQRRTETQEKNSPVSRFGYKVFSVSPQGFQRLQEEYMKYYNAITAVVASDNESHDRVVVVNLQLFTPSEIAKAESQ